MGLHGQARLSARRRAPLVDRPLVEGLCVEETTHAADLSRTNRPHVAQAFPSERGCAGLVDHPSRYCLHTTPGVTQPPPRPSARHAPPAHATLYATHLRQGGTPDANQPVRMGLHTLLCQPRTTRRRPPAMAAPRQLASTTCQPWLQTSPLPHPAEQRAGFAQLVLPGLSRPGNSASRRSVNPHLAGACVHPAGCSFARCPRLLRATGLGPRRGRKNLSRVYRVHSERPDFMA